MKAMDSVCVWRSRRRDFGTSKWLGFIKHLFYVHNTGERSEPEKNYDNKIKTTIVPLSYTSNIHTRPHLWQISGGGGGPDPRSPPLDPRMMYQNSVSKL